MKNNLLNEALQASKENKMEEWIHSFLNDSGNNIALSDGLKNAKRYWIGPLEIDLSLLNRIQGPTDEDKDEEIEEKWLKRVTPMINDLISDWEPAPLIAEYKEGKFMIRDGGHRHYSLKKAGRSKYWVIIWANSEKDYIEAKQSIKE